MGPFEWPSDYGGRTLKPVIGMAVFFADRMIGSGRDCEFAPAPDSGPLDGDRLVGQRQLSASLGTRSRGDFQSLIHQENRVANDWFQGPADVAR
jgi:hypothetical protein